MRLYLVQHGDALPKEVDPERALSDSGRADVESMAAFLEKKSPAVTRVLQSGKTRARQTAEILAAKTAPNVTIEEATGIDPLDNPGPLAQQAATWSADTMIVGHEPFLGKLTSHLVAGDGETKIVAFQPGTVVCLERAKDKWTLAWMLRPGLLKVPDTPPF